MKIIVLYINIFLFVFTVNAIPNNNTYQEIKLLRKSYVEAIKSESKTEAMIKDLQLKKEDSPIQLAYFGAFQGLMAKHVNNPFTKFDFLNDSKKTLAKAINLEPNNPEIRFLRFSMEYYIPSWLGFSQNIQSDKLAIIQNIDSLTERDVQSTIIKFLLDSKLCSVKESSILKSLSR